MYTCIHICMYIYICIYAYTYAGDITQIYAGDLIQNLTSHGIDGFGLQAAISDIKNGLSAKNGAFWYYYEQTPTSVSQFSVHTYIHTYKHIYIHIYVCIAIYIYIASLSPTGLGRRCLTLHPLPNKQKRGGGHDHLT